MSHGQQSPDRDHLLPALWLGLAGRLDGPGAIDDICRGDRSLTLIPDASGGLPGLVTIMSDGRDSRIKTPPRYNGAPGQEHWVIRQNPETGERTRALLWWGLIPYWNKATDGGRRPINAKAETVASLPTFRDAYQRRRCLLPVDNFFEWKAIKGAKTKQPYAIALQSGELFALAGIWENWKVPHTDEWMRTAAGHRASVGRASSGVTIDLAARMRDRWRATGT